MERETNEQLIQRFQNVKGLFEKASAQVQKAKYGSTRSQKAKLAGSLNFTLLGIRAEMEERGLALPSE